MKLFPLVTCFLLFFVSAAFSQPTNWSINPYEDKLFVENIGQWNPVSDDPVIAGVDNLGTEIFYTKRGFEYRHRRQRPVPSYLLVDAQDEEPDNEVEDHSRMLWDTLSIQAQWLGSAARNFVFEEPQKPLFHYAQPDGQLVGARSYSKLHCPDLYPHIDLDYAFHPVQGMKYDITVHPGGDPTALALQFSGMDQLFLDAQGNLHAQLGDAALIDHAPIAYLLESGATVPIRFVLSGTTLGFELDAYDPAQTLIIDPWLINPGFTSQGKVFDVSWDCGGNIYAFGGQSPWKVKKFDASGNLQWNYNTSHVSWYGDMIADDLGNVYLVEGCCDGNRQKLNTSGLVQWTVNNGVYEFWRLIFNCDWSQLVLANAYSGGAVAPAQSLSSVNTATGALTGGTSISGSEPRSIINSPSGNFYVLTSVGNQLLARTSTYAPFYSVSNGYAMLYNGPLYSNGTNTTQGQNGIAVYSNAIFTSNGATLMKRSLATGVLLASTPITGGVAEQNSGVAVDNCGNVYVGSSANVYQYDQNLNLIATIPMTGAVYDVTVSGLNAVLIAGNGLLSSQISPCPAVCQTCTVLPLSLSSFDVQASSQQQADLHWTMENLTQYARYTVERSADGANFQQLYSTSAAQLSYDWVDLAPLPGYSWYRLAMTDALGEIYYGPSRQVNLQTGLPEASVFPNPVQDQLKIQLPEGVTLRTWQLSDLQGRILSQGISATIDAQAWQNGLYILEIFTDRFVERTKILKVN